MTTFGPERFRDPRWYRAELLDAATTFSFALWDVGLVDGESDDELRRRALDVISEWAEDKTHRHHERALRYEKEITR